MLIYALMRHLATLYSHTCDTLTKFLRQFLFYFFSCTVDGQAGMQQLIPTGTVIFFVVHRMSCSRIGVFQCTWEKLMHICVGKMRGLPRNEVFDAFLLNNGFRKVGTVPVLPVELQLKSLKKLRL